MDSYADDAEWQAWLRGCVSLLSGGMHCCRAGFGFTDGETNLAIKFIAGSMLKQCPDWEPETLMRDAGLDPGVLNDTLPSHTELTCKWHFMLQNGHGNLGKNLGKLPLFAEMYEVVAKDMCEAYSIAAFDEAWNLFQVTYPGKPTEYVSKWVEGPIAYKTSWAKPWRQLTFTFGRVASSSAESANSVAVSWLSKSLESVLVVLPLMLRYEDDVMKPREQATCDDEEIAGSQDRRGQIFQHVSTREARKRGFSTASCKVFEAQQVQSLEYVVKEDPEGSNESMESWLCFRRGNESKARQVTRNRCTGVFACTCNEEKCMGFPMRHIIAVRRHLGLSTFDEVEWRPRWKQDTGTIETLPRTHETTSAEPMHDSDPSLEPGSPQNIDSDSEVRQQASPTTTQPSGKRATQHRFKTVMSKATLLANDVQGNQANYDNLTFILDFLHRAYNNPSTNRADAHKKALAFFNRRAPVSKPSSGSKRPEAGLINKGEGTRARRERAGKIQGSKSAKCGFCRFKGHDQRTCPIKALGTDVTNGIDKALRELDIMKADRDPQNSTQTIGNDVSWVVLQGREGKHADARLLVKQFGPEGTYVKDGVVSPAVLHRWADANHRVLVAARQSATRRPVGKRTPTHTAKSSARMPSKSRQRLPRKKTNVGNKAEPHVPAEEEEEDEEVLIL